MVMSPRDAEAAGSAMVPAGPARGLLRSLIAAGWSQTRLSGQLAGPSWKVSEIMRNTRISAADDLAVTAVYELLADRMPPEGTHRERIAASRARNLAGRHGWAPPPGHVRPASVPRRRRLTAAAATMTEYTTREPRVTAALAQEMLRSLIAAGWSQAQLAGRLGMDPGNFNVILTGRKRIAMATHCAVAALYRRLAEQMPPEGTPRERAAATHARNLADARGWSPPPGHIRPHRAAEANRAALERALREGADTARPPLKGRALAEDAIELAGYGVSREDIIRRLGVRWKTIEQAITRRNREMAKAAGAPAASAPAAVVITLDPPGRLGCGTILALLLHQELGEPACERCAANAARRGYRVRTAAGTGLAA
jgi:transcriptional regulator with XRE-family HTH domain